ncbi:hypothetical protein [Streptomyces sp. NPDC058295]|uniref:hypothetical protein n=1 Tax=Streptomyces sp. NPDC058295 TaxID=3346431 RepID=UPI0036EECC22
MTVGWRSSTRENADTQVTAKDGPVVRDAALDRTARWMLSRATAAALHFDADHDRTAPSGDPDPDSAPTGREEARAWLAAERAQWLAALRRAHDTGGYREVLDAAEAMHWFSDLYQHWEQWVEVFRRSSDAARALGSRREEAVHLNYLAWAHNLCVHDPRAALVCADAALAAARDSEDGLQHRRSPTAREHCNGWAGWRRHTRGCAGRPTASPRRTSRRPGWPSCPCSTPSAPCCAGPAGRRKPWSPTAAASGSAGRVSPGGRRN